MKYFIKCDHCSFRRISENGNPEDFSDLREVNLCPKCNGPRTFKCPGCGFIVKARRYVEPPAPEKHYFSRE